MNITESQNFDLARAIFMSYATEGSDVSLSEVLREIRELSGLDAFNRALVLAAAMEDPRYAQYGCADVLPLIKRLELTDDLKADVETLLDAMRIEDAAQLETARRKTMEDDDPYRKAAIRLLTKFRSPNMAQIERELTRL